MALNLELAAAVPRGGDPTAAFPRGRRDRGEPAGDLQGGADARSSKAGLSSSCARPPAWCSPRPGGYCSSTPGRSSPRSAPPRRGWSRSAGLRDGVLRVGASTTLASYFLPPILGELYRAYPRIDLQLLSANARTVIGAVLEHQVELGLVEGPLHDGRLEIRPWREDELLVVAAPGHPLTRKRSVTGAQLMEELLLLREEGAGTRDVMLAALRRRRWTPRRSFEVNSTEAIKGLVAAGVGWAALSARAVHDDLQVGRELKTDRRPRIRPQTDAPWVRWRARRLGPAATAFRSLAEGFTFASTIKACHRARAGSPRHPGPAAAREASSRSPSCSPPPSATKHAAQEARGPRIFGSTAPSPKGMACAASAPGAAASKPRGTRGEGQEEPDP